MAQIIKSGNLKMTKEVIFTSDLDQIVYIKFINKSMSPQYINAYWSNGELHKEQMMDSSGDTTYYAHSQHELIMRIEETITAEGSEEIEYQIIA